MWHFQARGLVYVLTVWVASTVWGASPKGFEVAPPPSWILTAEIPVAGAPQEHPSGVDFFLLDQQVHIEKGQTYLRRAYQIVSDSGRQNSGQLSLSFDPSYQSLTIHHLQLRREAETIDKLEVDRFQVLQQERDLDRQLYNGTLTAFIILEDLRIGDVIDVAYTIQGWNPVFGDHFMGGSGLGWAVPVRDFRYRLVVPAGKELQTRIHGSGTPQASVRTLDGGETERVWGGTHLPQVQPEDDVPADHVVFPFLDVTDFASWGQVVEWAQPLYARDSSPTPLIDALVAKLRDSGETQEAVAVAALAFVQKEIRYLGIEMGAGSHRPSPPEDVLRRRFGDCKDKTRLLVTLLERLHLRASPALVNSSSGNLVLRRLPSPYVFDHVVVLITFLGKDYLVDPTLSYQRGATLEARHVGAYRSFLRVADGVSQIETTGYGSGDVSRTHVDETFVVTDLNQPATLKVVTRYEGRSAQSARAYFAQMSREQITRVSLDFYHQYYPGITAARAWEMKDDEASGHLTFTEFFSIRDLFSASGKGGLLLAHLQPGTIWSRCRFPSFDQRQHPFALPYPTLVTQLISLELPMAWPVEPTETTVTDPAFEISVKVSRPTPQTVLFSHSWQTRSDRVAVERLPEFGRKIQEAQDQLGYVLTYNTALEEGAPYVVNWLMVALTVLWVAGGAFVVRRFAWRKNPAVSHEPPVLPGSYHTPGKRSLEGLGGWLVLVGIGLVATPFVLLGEIISGHRAYFNQSVWESLTTPGSLGYVSNFAFVAPVELSLLLFGLVYNVFVLVLFFRRSYRLPFHMQIYLVTRVVTTALTLWINSLIVVETVDPNGFESVKLLFQSIIGACLWVPYFSLSRRVKLTFVR